MSITPQQIALAESIQQAAAQDASGQVRLVAGPGTGKSSSIERRILWLLQNGLSPSDIAAVSFTRASAHDLARKVHTYCSNNGQPQVSNVRVSTLHSLALRVLRRAGLLGTYPSDPVVLDKWEQECIFDSEFGYVNKITSSDRCEQIRLHHEAFWSTGQWSSPNYIPPVPPISSAERNALSSFHLNHTQVYSCVLPGEIVRQCVDQTSANTINPLQLLGLQHLIVDEFQDLNPYDLRFVDQLISRGAIVFVAGDDDQSVYSFRYASPAGIQNFASTSGKCGQHILTYCFRCTPTIIGAAQALTTAYPPANRIPKNLISLYTHSSPPVQGVVHRWTFKSGVAEARAIAKSCRDLIQTGVQPDEIMILLTSVPALGKTIADELDAAGVPYEPPRPKSFVDTPSGRLGLALIRIVCTPDDYVAHRTVLGMRRGVGIKTCSDIASAVTTNNLNFRNLFYNPIPPGVFTTRATNALRSAASVIATISSWQASDTLTARAQDIQTIITNTLTSNDATLWNNHVSPLPQGITLEELRDYLWADRDDQRAKILSDVLKRLGQSSTFQPVPKKARLMTMHGAKGLSGQVVLIPGLEDSILPGVKRSPYPGLVLEAARLLYVSITRGRAACILSRAKTRFVNGQWTTRTPSRFCTATGGPFQQRTSGLSQQEVQNIIQDIANL